MSGVGVAWSGEDAAADLVGADRIVAVAGHDKGRARVARRCDDSDDELVRVGIGLVDPHDLGARWPAEGGQQP